MCSPVQSNVCFVPPMIFVRSVRETDCVLAGDWLCAVTHHPRHGPMDPCSVPTFERYITMQRKLVQLGSAILDVATLRQCSLGTTAIQVSDEAMKRVRVGRDVVRAVSPPSSHRSHRASPRSTRPVLTGLPLDTHCFNTPPCLTQSMRPLDRCIPHSVASCSHLQRIARMLATMVC
jgi:hypothetical protein